jgi:hypothetical protein
MILKAVQADIASGGEKTENCGRRRSTPMKLLTNWTRRWF